MLTAANEHGMAVFGAGVLYMIIFVGTLLLIGMVATLLRVATRNIRSKRHVKKVIFCVDCVHNDKGCSLMDGVHVPPDFYCKWGEKNDNLRKVH